MGSQDWWLVRSTVNTQGWWKQHLSGRISYKKIIDILWQFELKIEEKSEKKMLMIGRYKTKSWQ